MRVTLIIAIVLFSLTSVKAQDTMRKRQVNVTSSFKPQLKEAAKINLNASPPQTDTTRPVLQYNIPNQNLLFAYQPGSLKPLAMSVDSVVKWATWNYAKVGYGSLNTPYFETGLSITNGSNAGLNIYGNYVSSKGKIEYQKFDNTKVDLNGFVRTGGNNELTGRIGFVDEHYNKYGGFVDNQFYSKDSIPVHFQTLCTRLAFRNINPTAYGISYAPEVRIDVFTDKINNRETNTYFNLPLRKTLGGRFEAELALDGGFTNYEPKNNTRISTSYISFNPSLFVKTTNIYLQAGIKPSWDNGAFKIMPNVLAEISTTDKRASIIAGWTGHLRTNSYQSLAAINPWIWAPATVNNSRIEEIYLGVKGALTDHFSYTVRGGVNTYTNQPLFINDTITGKSFSVLNEPSMKALNVHGEIGYTMGDKFTLRSSLNLNHYMNMAVNEEAWGLLPLEFTTSIRLQILKDLYAKEDFYAFDAPYYRLNSAIKGKLPGAMDITAGLEFAVAKNVKIWTQFNNILNSQYERWKGYPTYGFNFVGGIVFSFAQNQK